MQEVALLLLGCWLLAAREFRQADSFGGSQSLVGGVVVTGDWLSGDWGRFMYDR